MENHHYVTAVALLQRPGHDILAELSADDRQEVTEGGGGDGGGGHTGAGSLLMAAPGREIYYVGSY